MKKLKNKKQTLKNACFLPKNGRGEIALSFIYNDLLKLWVVIWLI